MRRVPTLAFVVAVALVGQMVIPMEATTIRELAFSQIVDSAAVIVRGRVVGLRSFRNASGPVPLVRKEGSMPASPGASAPAAAAAAERPIGLPVEGTGRMIFTEVDLEVEESLKGGGGSLVRFTVAGGTVDGVTARVHGLPTFQSNEDLLLFMRAGYERAADPVVGVNQGAFRIVNEGGGDVMLNADSNYVIGVENDRIVARRNPRAPLASTHLVPNLAGAPMPDSSDVVTSASAAATRFWTSREPAMGVTAFKEAVAARLAR